MKIITTVGSNLKSIDDIIKYIKAGTDIFRFNFSHINYEKSNLFISFLKSNFPEIYIVADLQGNKIRVSSLLKNEYKALQGEKIYICLDNIFNTISSQVQSKRKKVIPVSFAGNFNSLIKGDIMLLNDGNTKLIIDSVGNDGNFILSTVANGGLIRAGKSINIPSLHKSIPYLSPKDLNDLLWVAKKQVTIITIPYVSKSEDISTVKKILNTYVEEGILERIPLIWGKIETLIKAPILNDIINTVDGIVIGRGDLSKEVPLNLIPEYQNEIITSCNKINKPVILSNSILTSMNSKKSPTINEVYELYTHINQNVYGVILCDEVSSGNYPLNTLRFLKSFISYYKLNS